MKIAIASDGNLVAEHSAIAKGLPFLKPRSALKSKGSNSWLTPGINRVFSQIS